LFVGIMASLVQRSTFMALMAVICLLLNSNVVVARPSRHLSQVTQRAAAAREAVNFAPIAESRAVPAVEVTTAPRAEAVGPIVAQGPSAEEASVSELLFKAVRARNLARVRSLLKEDANTDVYSTRGTTPLIEAIALNASGIITAILDKGVDTNLPSKPDGNTPLHYAVTLGNIKLATRLLNAGADINLANSAGDTPLFALLKQTPINYRAIQLLLRRTPSPTTSAVDFSLTDAEGRTAQQLAEASGDRRLIKLFQSLPPASEEPSPIRPVAPTAGSGAGTPTEELPLVITAPAAEIVGVAPTAEAGAFPIVAPGVEVGETLATTTTEEPALLP
jgi:hypothetical protein